MALPRGAMGLSAVCDCGNSDYTHLLSFLLLMMCSLQQMLEIIALVLKSNVQAKYTKNVFKGSLHKLILYI